MFFRILLFLLVLACGYATYEIVRINSYYGAIQKTSAEFTVRGGGNHPSLTIVEFLNYSCEGCKKSHLVMMDFAKNNPDIRIVTRPMPYEYMDAETAAERALAAGLQGKFDEIDRALVEYRGKLDEKFWRESAALYDIDYDRMVREAEEETVQKMAGENATASILARIDTTPALMIGRTVYQLDKALTLPDLIRMVQVEKER